MIPSGPALLVIVGVALSIWAGGKVVHGTKVVAHKAKCGIEHVIGKHCEPKQQ